MSDAGGAGAPHQIVIVGGGAAGLELATALGDKLGKRGKAEVTLIDCARTHIWKPLLHEIAAGSMDIDQHALDYLAQAHWHHFRFRLGRMTGLDRRRREIHIAATFGSEGNEITPARSLGYDTLVLAIGGVTNDFGTPGAREHAISLDTPDEAERFHERVVNACLRADAQDGPVRPGQLHIAIIGAGATGTELAAELHRTTRLLVAYGLDRIDPDKDIRLMLIEGAERILPALPERIAESVTNLLKKLDIQILTSSRVTEVRPDGVCLADGKGFLPAELTVWAAGVKGPDILADLDGLEATRSNQLVVEPTLQTTRDPDVFAVGDCAYAVLAPGARPVPPRAQASHQEARHMVGQLQRRLAGKPLKPFVYRDFGSLVSLGEYNAVASLMGFIAGKGLRIEGLFARLMYRSLYAMHQKALHGYTKVTLDIIARALTRRTEPRVKLH